MFILNRERENRHNMVKNQAYLFLIFTVTGIIIGILFDIFRSLRKSFKTKDWLTYVQDILFWILTGVILLYTIFTFGDGEVRFYMFIGVFIGCMFYMIIFSQYFISCNVAMINFIKKVCKFIAYPIYTLSKMICKIIAYPIYTLSKMIHRNIIYPIHTLINLKQSRKK